MHCATPCYPGIHAKRAAGVTSNEFWRILDCDDSYEWCLFYYSGAASAAGAARSHACFHTIYLPACMGTVLDTWVFSWCMGRR